MNRIPHSRLFVPGRGISTPQKPAPYPSCRRNGSSRERIPFVREGARAIPVQPIYEDAAGYEEGED